MPLDLTDDKSTLVQVMAWYHQATSHYLSQCWPRSMSTNGVTRPQWVNSLSAKKSHKLQNLTMYVFLQYHSPFKGSIRISVISRRGPWKGAYGDTPFNLMIANLLIYSVCIPKLPQPVWLLISPLSLMRVFSDLVLWRHHSWSVTSPKHRVLALWHIHWLLLHMQIGAKAIFTSE